MGLVDLKAKESTKSILPSITPVSHPCPIKGLCRMRLPASGQSCLPGGELHEAGLSTALEEEWEF